MIRFEQVSKRLGGRLILQELSFDIKRGEIFTVVGPSGTGKSVTLKHMVRLLTPDSGTIWLEEKNINSMRGRKLKQMRSRFGYLFQGGALLGWMSVADNVALPLRETTRMSELKIEQRVIEVLEMVGLAEDGHKFPSEISGGMHKRAGLARAIVHNPEIVLFDEPTSGLDPVTARTIDKLITSLSQNLGITSVVVTHDLQGALLTADRIAMLTGGNFIEMSRPADFVKSTVPPVRAFLDAQFISKQGIPGMKGGQNEL